MFCLKGTFSMKKGQSIALVLLGLDVIHVTVLILRFIGVINIANNPLDVTEQLFHQVFFSYAYNPSLIIIVVAFAAALFLDIGINILLLHGTSNANQRSCKIWQIYTFIMMTISVLALIVGLILRRIPFMTIIIDFSELILKGFALSEISRLINDIRNNPADYMNQPLIPDFIE